MKVVVQNLQKRSGLASELVEKYEPDILLAQEISWSSEPESFQQHSAHNTAWYGYGTCIYAAQGEITNVRKVNSPHAEIGGFIYKKTILAEWNGVFFVSFHGYNGQPMKNIANLVDHVIDVLAQLPTSIPAVFAGDFNTWSQNHLDAVAAPLAEAGFVHACSWPYPGREFPLDHVFVRGVELCNCTVYKSSSDHQGAVLELAFSSSS
jgi:exonuclease III